MTKEEFKKRFQIASEECIDFAKNLIIDELPRNYLFNLYKNLYKKDGSREEKYTRLTLEEAVDKLYRNGSVPRWVDVGVVKVDDGYTIIKCDYGTSFVNDDSKLQFANEKLSPFQVKGPSFSSCDKIDSTKQVNKVPLGEFNEEIGRLK